MPALAACYAWRNFSTSFFCNLAEFLMGLMTKDKSDRQAELGKEIHLISCASKPLSSWTAQQVIQECREACGGNGYLKGSFKQICFKFKSFNSSYFFFLIKLKSNKIGMFCSVLFLKLIKRFM